MSIAGDCLAFCRMFKGELLAELMLRHWEHPLAEDTDYRNGLLENAAKVIRISMESRAYRRLTPLRGELRRRCVVRRMGKFGQLLPEIPAEELQQREAWLRAMRQAVPSCFCDQSKLSE